MKRLRSRLTYANVISTLALFLVLAGGTAFAAKQMLPKNSVGSKQIKNKAITGAKIKNGAVTGAKIAPGAITQVASAANASHATSADSAANSQALGGVGPAGYQGRTMWAFVSGNGQILSQSGGITVEAHDEGATWFNFPQQVGGKAIVATPWAGDVGRDVTVEVAPCGYVSAAATPGSIGCDHGTNTLSDAFVGTDKAGKGASLSFYVVVVP